MKVYSIGRESGCDIVINDSTDVISRRHAVLTVMPSGKMTITDQSHNGTYVNGIRISPNVAVPVTRKDNISFAHVARLDWNRVPKSQNMMRYALYALIAVIVIVGVVFAWKAIDGKKPNPAPAPVNQEQVNKDSLDKVQKEKAKADSIKDAETKAKIKADREAAAARKATKEKQDSTSKKSKSSKKTETPEKCRVCNKDIKDCEYKGQHPRRQDL